MIGQTKLVKKLNSYSLQTFPKTILLLGPKGCGKHLLAQEQAQRLGIELTELTGKVEAEELIEFQQSPITRMYVVDLTGYTEKQQNQFLKFIEEPGKNVYIVLLAESEVGILETVLNRCIKFYFEQYTIDELKMTNWLNVYSNDLVYKICKTPGQLQCVNEQHVEELYNICSKLLTDLPIATCANVVSLEYKFDYKQEFAGKYDFDMFFNMLEYVSFEDYLKNNRKTSLTIYKLTTEYRQKQIGRNLVKETLMINFLAMLWEAVR